MFFKNLEKEINNSPAIMMVVLVTFFILIVANITGIIDVIFAVLCIVLWILEAYKYKKKY